MRKYAVIALVTSSVIILVFSLGTYGNGENDYARLGYGYIDEGNYREALETFEAAVKEQPKSLRAWTGMGVTLTGLNRYEGALKAFDKALSIAAREGTYVHPAAASIWASKGAIYLALNNHIEAMKAFDRALALRPDYAEVWYEGALVHALMNDKEKSLNYLASAIRLNPKFKKKARLERAFKPLWFYEDFNLIME